jgi:hypothetical protein
MMRSNPASTPAEVNLKLVNNEDEELIDPTLFKQIVGSMIEIYVQYQAKYRFCCWYN